MITDEMDSAEVFGVAIPDLPKGQMAVDVFILVKTLDTQTGDIKHWDLRSKNLNHQEAMGMAISAADSIRSFLVNGHHDCEEGH